MLISTARKSYVNTFLKYQHIISIQDVLLCSDQDITLEKVQIMISSCNIITHVRIIVEYLLRESNQVEGKID